jgi:Plasmid maintenance system killer protein
MIKSFRHKGLARLFADGSTKGIRQDLVARCERRLAALNAAKVPEDLNIPGFNFHSLQGKPKRYSVHVNGPFCITFEWDNGAFNVDLENYH